ncbi:2Fe-2S ferredoxin-type domain-containing protein [Podospora appendiculata]|uniref:2Fe-2S ferredoxin-type domain-containing protein n=1 Tax=Podospora appendiculata TaxID=314037 RepID=A0AAE0X4K9_9PEZI|nr:2Fe-2S ferredoxin-type domain-containing protein [Podospora appendiculata]
MSIPRTLSLSQALPRLRVDLRQTSRSTAQHVRCYSKTSPTPRLAVPCRISRSIATVTTPTATTAAAAQRIRSRPFSSSPAVSHGHVHTPKPGEELHVTFIDKEGEEHKIAVAKGDNLLDIAQAHDLEMEGACGGSCACSTCHVIVTDQDYYDKMPEPDDDENDMLDLAFGLTETSRLGCQVHMTPELDGLRIKLPSMTRNLQSSDFK